MSTTIENVINLCYLIFVCFIRVLNGYVILPPAPLLNNNPNHPSWICILCVIWFCLTTHDISIEKKTNKQIYLEALEVPTNLSKMCGMHFIKILESNEKSVKSKYSIGICEIAHTSMRSMQTFLCTESKHLYLFNFILQYFIISI